MASRTWVEPGYPFTTWMRVPNSELNARAWMLLTAVGPEAPKIALFENSSWNDVIFEAALTTHVPIVWSMFPIQVNLSISNWAFVSPILTENSVDDANMPMIVPSL